MAGNWTVPVTDAACVMMSSDYSQQEPKITGFVANDAKMCKAFQEGRDIYATIAGLAFNMPYEKCLEFHPETHEYQPDGKARRGEAKTIVLGICYGRSTITIGEQLYGKDTSLTEEQRTKKAQGVYDAVLNAFPQLRTLMQTAQATARQKGYVETILGRRRHIPDMTLPEFEFRPMSGYVNPDVDPLDPETLKNQGQIPERIVQALQKEFKSYKYFGQIARRTRELHDEEHIKVINNRPKITEASRQCVNCVDVKTEILTPTGWKPYYRLSVGDQCYGFNQKTGKLEITTINQVLIYDQEESYTVNKLEGHGFSAYVTPEHRWVTQPDGHPTTLMQTTKEMLGSLDNNIVISAMFGEPSEESAGNWDVNLLKLFAWINVVCITRELTSNALNSHIALCFPRSEKGVGACSEVKQLLESLEIPYTSTESTLYVSVFTSVDNTRLFPVLHPQYGTVPGGLISHNFVRTLSGSDARVLMDTLIHAQQSLKEDVQGNCYQTYSKAEADVIQQLAVVAGYYSSASTVNDKYYIEVCKDRRYPVDSLEVTSLETPIVWCVSTGLGTWVARRSGSTYITGNSIIQGSAAEMTKMAMLMLHNNEEWQRLGGRLLVPVHDELICEAPIQNYERCAQILSDMMVEAGNFLPFPINCDVEITYRWYGNEYPCPYPQPKSMDNLTEDEVKWVQYHLLEVEYLLPVIKNEDGSKPIGAAAKGINGKVTPEYEEAIRDYIARSRIRPEEFIEHIHHRVDQGV